MARITGNVLTGEAPAANAYVQLRNGDGDFCGETHADDDGHFHAQGMNLLNLFGDRVRDLNVDAETLFAD